MILSIDEIRDKIRPICEKYKIEKVWLFGSYARGEAREDSDVDVHMEVPKGDRGCLGSVVFMQTLKKPWAKKLI